MFIKSRFEKGTLRKGASTLSVTVDLLDNIVLIFSKKRLNGVIKLSIDEYLSYFETKSRKKISNLFEIIRQNVQQDFDSTLELNSFHSTKKKKLMFSVFYINSINQERHLIHATQYFFTNIPATEGLELKKLNKVKSMFNVAENNLKIRTRNVNGSKGMVCLFRYSISSSLKNEDISANIYYTLIDIITKYINNNRILSRGRGKDLLVFDFKVSKRKVIYKMLIDIKKEFTKHIEMGGMSNRISFNIGVVEFKYYPKDYHKILKALNQVSNEMVVKKKDILFYDNQSREEYYFDKSYKNEVQAVIHNHSFKYNFAPIISTSSYEVIGYFSKPIPISTIFSDIDEIKGYAYKLTLSRDLFSEVTKYLLSKFVNETNEKSSQLHLFYNLSCHELSYANSLLGFFMTSKKVNIVLSFNESDMLKNLEKDTNYIESFRKLSSKGYQIALEVTLKTLEFPDQFYSLFDYFVFNQSYFEKNFDDVSHSSLSMKKAIEKVLKFNKKVVISEVNSWNDVETRIQENLKLLSGSAISPYSEMILPVEKKLIEKIKKFKKRG